MTYRILSIDPGLNNTGLATFDIDYTTRSIISINTVTLSADKLIDRTGLDEDCCLERIHKLYRLKNAFKYLISNINPIITVCESPFYNRFRPTAYSALVETIAYLHSAVIEFNPNICWQQLEPLLVKKIVGAGMLKGKLDVKAAILNKPDLINKLQQNIHVLDEHSIDAIAIGYSFLQASMVKEN